MKDLSAVQRYTLLSNFQCANADTQECTQDGTQRSQCANADTQDGTQDGTIIKRDKSTGTKVSSMSDASPTQKEEPDLLVTLGSQVFFWPASLVFAI